MYHFELHPHIVIVMQQSYQEDDRFKEISILRNWLFTQKKTCLGVNFKGRSQKMSDEKKFHISKVNSEKSIANQGLFSA